MEEGAEVVAPIRKSLSYEPRGGLPEIPDENSPAVQRALLRLYLESLSPAELEVFTAERKSTRGGRAEEEAEVSRGLAEKPNASPRSAIRDVEPIRKKARFESERG